MQKFWMTLGAAAVMASPLISAQAAVHGRVSQDKVSPVGTTSFAPSKALVPMAAGASAAAVTDDAPFGLGMDFPDLDPLQVNDSAFKIPAPTSAAVVPAAKGVTGFDGLDIYDQDTAGTGVYTNTQYGLEPPDQALAVGSGYVVESVNNAIAVYKANGKLASVPIPTNQFFGLEPEYLRTSKIYGSQSLSDPRAYYDAETGRFFIEEWSLGQNPDGSLTGTSEINVAVSQTSDPTGAYSLYRFDTSADPNDPGDLILPDYVQIGADANGFYMSINQFSLYTGGFVGQRILAVSKADLVAGTPTPIVSFSGGDLGTGPTSSPAGFTVYPAITPAGGTYATAAGGTEYFLSSVFDSTANQLGIWAISNTSSLNTKTPSLSLTDTLMTTQPFTQPTSAIQKAGPYPQGMSLGYPEELVASGDTRMTQVTYVLGHLYSAVETSFPDGTRGTNSGFTYFSVAPAVDGSGNVSGIVDHQGYARVAGETLSYPSFAVTSTGGAVITCALVGPDFYPSAAFISLDSHLKASTLSISSLGVAPDDGFTGYSSKNKKGQPIQGTARWGDYSEAQVDENGNIWIAQETISTKSNSLRPSFANWGTFITKVKPTGTIGYGGTP